MGDNHFTISELYNVTQFWFNISIIHMFNMLQLHLTSQKGGMQHFSAKERSYESKICNEILNALVSAIKLEKMCCKWDLDSNGNLQQDILPVMGSKHSTEYVS